MKTHINKYKALAFSFLLIFICLSLKAQVVWENPRYEVYNFLSRQAQKGALRIDDFIQPLSRKEIYLHLSGLQDSLEKLSLLEKKELDFYLREYTEFTTIDSNSVSFLKKDPSGRLSFLSVNKNDFVFRGEPVLTLETQQSENSSIFKLGNGMQFWGHAGKNFGFQFYFQDFTETGRGIDSLKDFSPEQGIVRTNTIHTERLTYSEIRGNISYSWKNGSIAIGKDNLLLGYGQNGRIILSDKSPSYPFIRLDYKPLKWLTFQYAHAWLQSGIIDSANSYPTGNSVYGGKRELYRQKFMATHSLNFFPVKGLALSVGESMIFSDRFDIGYLIPVMFFKAYDHYTSRHNISAGSNGQFFFQASSRNHIPKTHLYASAFIDEIRITKVFERAKSRNQLGFTIGASATDVLFPYLTLGIEYTRLNPFVYNNIINAQSYRNQNYLLGDWIGNNADRLIGYVEYTPLPRLKAQLQWQHVRKGGEGTLEDQYYKEPQPEFLFNLYRQQTETQLGLSYQWIHNLYIKARLTILDDENALQNSNGHSSRLQMGLNIGL